MDSRAREQRVESGDPSPDRSPRASFDHLYRRHVRDVYRFALRDVGDRHEAEDVTQTAFLNAYRALERGHEPRRPLPWLFGIARNVVRGRFRRQTRRPAEVHLDTDLADSLPDPDGNEAGELRDALEGLRPRHRAVLFLREVEGLSYREIAERLHMSHSAVEALLFRARRALREELEAGAAPSLVRRIRGAAMLPIGLVDRLGLALGRPDLVTKAAGAVAATVVGAGVVVATGTVSIAASDESGHQAEAARDERADLIWTPGFRVAAPASGPLRAKSELEPAGRGEGRKERGGGKNDRGKGQKQKEREAKTSAPPPSPPPAPSASGGTSGSNGGGAGAAVPLPEVSAPSVPLPEVHVPAVPPPPALPEVPSVPPPPAVPPAPAVPSAPDVSSTPTLP